jgi:hypothetical protein
MAAHSSRVAALVASILGSRIEAIGGAASHHLPAAAVCVCVNQHVIQKID